MLRSWGCGARMSPGGACTSEYGLRAPRPSTCSSGAGVPQNTVCKHLVHQARVYSESGLRAPRPSTCSSGAGVHGPR